MYIRALVLLCVISVCCATDCPDGWTAFQGSCYLFGHGGNVTFTEAEHFCRQHFESHLVHVDNADENLFIKDVLRRSKAYRSWMGLTDENIEGIWVWYDTTQKATFSDWYSGEPNNQGSSAGDPGEDCAEFHRILDYQWNDAHCSNKVQPVCEKRGWSGAVEVVE